MRFINNLFGIYGPDFFVFGLLAAIAVAVPAATDAVSGWMSGVALLVLIVPRLLAQLHDWFLGAAYKALARVATWVGGKLMAVPGLVSLLILVVVLAVLGGIGFILVAGIAAESSLGRTAEIAALVIAAAGIVGHYGWFRWRKSAWQSANS